MAARPPPNGGGRGQSDELKKFLDASHQRSRGSEMRGEGKKAVLSAQSSV